MSDRNWEAEMAKIDKQLASVSDEQLLAERKPVPTGKGTGARPTTAAPASVPSARAASTDHGGAWRSWVKVIAAVAAAGSLMYWPWPARCGLPVVGFTVATGGVALLGIWSAIGTWRHRLGLAHVASILVTAWGLMLGAREVLPRIGYAIPTLERAGQWSCDGLPPLPTSAPSTAPSTAPSIAPATLPTAPPTSAPSPTRP